MRHPGSLIRAAAISLAVLVVAPTRAAASFHEWEIVEVYSNADGSIQYIELFTTFGSQQFVNTQTITTTDGTTVRSFTFPSNAPGDSASKRLLLATPRFAALPGAVTPNFVLPCGPFFTPGNAGNITITFVGADAITFLASTLPTDGSNALHDSTPGGAATLGAAANTPKNFAGTEGSLSCPGTSCNACDDGLFCTGTESCVGSACVSAGACTMICDEGADTCVACNSPADCNDNNVCTSDDACTGNVCVRTNNMLTCDDGLFCTLTDVCGGGACGGSGDACAGQNCNEGSNTCGQCLVAGDCDDGAFCNGAETCSGATTCEAAAAPPCLADLEVCDEVNDECDLICGNGVLDGTEVCDDGNAASDDGCDIGCQPEAGWTCDGAEPTVCTEVVTPDAGVEPDAAVAPDAGTTEPPAEDDGCCSTGAPRPGSALLSLLVLGLALRRRRR